MNGPPSADSRHLAPEDTFRCPSDVFAFGMIRSEIVAGGPAFPESLNQLQIAFMVAILCVSCMAKLPMSCHRRDGGD
jgi:hypothetical protein